MNYKAASIIAVALAAIGYTSYHHYQKQLKENKLSDEKREELQRMLDSVPEIVRPTR